VTRPVFSVVVPAYNARGVISTALGSLKAQRLREPFEVVVVDSGPESCADQVERWLPGSRVVRVGERLWPAAARNAGVRSSRGEHIAFIPADCEASPNWLAERLRVHRQGYDAVGGSIVNGDPGNVVATAEYLLEYSALLPNGDLLRRQAIPHALSFHRSIFDRFGLYPEHVTTGEDTLFNRRCVEAGVSIGFAPTASLAHHGSRTLRQLLIHASNHGRGLQQCVAADALPSAVGGVRQPVPEALVRMLVIYPTIGLVAKLRRFVHYQRRLLPTFVALAPIIAAGLVATGLGAFREWRTLRPT
jgi:glycosyltransferase involved in cell wall biosynthesis